MVAMDLPVRNEQVLGLVVNYLFQYKAVCSVAMVSKFQNKCIRETVTNRKQNLFVDADGESLASIIHSYGSMRCYAYKKPFNSNQYWLGLCCCQADGVYKRNFFSGFIFPLPHKPAPFLNRKNEWCFDGVGNEVIFIGNLVGGETTYNIVRYKLSGAALPLILKIPSDCGDGFFHCKAINFRNYPSLLKSILAVKKIKQKWFEAQKEGFLRIDVFPVSRHYLEINLDDVFFEENWNKPEKFLDEQDFLALERHPSLKSIFEKQYKKQCELNDWFVV